MKASLSKNVWRGYARLPEIIHCEKKNPRTGNVFKSFCEKFCPERKNGCKPGLKT
jgi:hypothetical protein